MCCQSGKSQMVRYIQLYMTAIIENWWITTSSNPMLVDIAGWRSSPNSSANARVSVVWIVLDSWTAWPTMMVLTANSTAINATPESLVRKFEIMMWTTKSLTLPWSNPMIRPKIVQGVEERFSKPKQLLAKTDYITRNVPIVLPARNNWRTTPYLMVLELHNFGLLYRSDDLLFLGEDKDIYCEGCYHRKFAPSGYRGAGCSSWVDTDTSNVLRHSYQAF